MSLAAVRVSPFRGLSYEQRYGSRAQQEKDKRVAGGSGWPKGKTWDSVVGSEKATVRKKALVLQRTGLSYAEMFSPAVAEVERLKRALPHRAKVIAPKYDEGNNDKREGWRYREWKRAVLFRDKHQCLRCFSKEKIQPHHIKSWTAFPELRYEVSNGETLCLRCHREEHRRRALGL
jgi:hypothetical protein